MLPKNSFLQLKYPLKCEKRKKESAELKNIIPSIYYYIEMGHLTVMASHCRCFCITSNHIVEESFTK